MAHQSFESLRNELQCARKVIPRGATYLHSKTHNIYEVSDHTIWEETDEVAVVYRPLEYPDVSFTRSLLSWVEEVEIDGQLVPRFQRLG